LVIIQTIDGDIGCDGTDADHVAEFGASVAEALDVIQATSPNSRILMVGQLGRPDPAFVEKLVAADPTVKATLTGTGPCDFFNPAGDLVEENFETLTRIIESYEAEQERWCAAVRHWRTDGGARAEYVDELENFTSDWNHLNVRGSERAAEIAWPAVVALLELSKARTDCRSSRSGSSRPGIHPIVGFGGDRPTTTWHAAVSSARCSAKPSAISAP
jgi:hypothetical protein